jgi:spore maturation protein CgeB
LKIAIFGLTLSSSWGNGHATPYRAIIGALHQRGVDVTFYERDVPYYAAHRDFRDSNNCELVIYTDWEHIRQRALQQANSCDVAIVASYCPEGARIADEVLDLKHTLRVFYDLDTPITLRGLQSRNLEYLRCEQIAEFDLYLSFTGGKILQRLEREFGARLARALYGCVDPDVYRRTPPREEFASSLSYMGTYASDRQQKLDELFLGVAQRRHDWTFVLAGSLYPWQWTWPSNVRRHEHVPPDSHPALYSSSRATLNLTREEMAESGYCPSGRFFEAAACGTPILTDRWEGLEQFFDPRTEVVPVRTAAEVIEALDRPDAELQEVASRARQRTLDEHTGKHRAAELLAHCEEARSGKRKSMEVAS